VRNLLSILEANNYQRDPWLTRYPVDNLSNATNVFVDEAAGDMNVASGSPVLAIPGFVPTPFSEVGIQP